MTPIWYAPKSELKMNVLTSPKNLSESYAYELLFNI